MTEDSSPNLTGSTRAPKKTPGPWRRLGEATLALLLSLLFPGLGQIFNHQPLKALAVAAAGPLLLLLSRTLELLHSFPGLITFLVLGMGLEFFVLGDAFWMAWKEKRKESPLRHRAVTLVSFIVLISFYVIASFNHLSIDRILQFGAFRLRARSMAPTVCEDERIIVDTGVFTKKNPQRGDIVAFLYGPERITYLKRIAAIGGDLVQGSDTTLYVNGKPFPRVPVGGTGCTDEFAADSEADNNQSGPTRVPQGMFFVVGDNWNHSWDSRYPGFGFVSRDRIRGKPLFIYWSPYHSRIGKKIE